MQLVVPPPIFVNAPRVAGECGEQITSVHEFPVTTSLPPPTNLANDRSPTTTPLNKCPVILFTVPPSELKRATLLSSRATPAPGFPLTIDPRSNIEALLINWIPTGNSAPLNRRASANFVHQIQAGPQTARALLFVWRNDTRHGAAQSSWRRRTSHSHIKGARISRAVIPISRGSPLGIFDRHAEQLGSVAVGNQLTGQIERCAG